MKPVIVSYDCTDHDPIDKWVPQDPLIVDFWMNFTIGPNKTAGDNFQVRVITKNCIQPNQKTERAIVLNTYSWPSLLATVESMLENNQGKDWCEIRPIPIAVSGAIAIADSGTSRSLIPEPSRSLIPE